MRRLRCRLGLWLVRPWLVARGEIAYEHAKNRDKPESYHADWWWGQYFALHGLLDDLKYVRAPQVEAARTGGSPDD